MNEFYSDFRERFDQFGSQSFLTEFNESITSLGAKYGEIIRAMFPGSISDAKEQTVRNKFNQAVSGSESARKKNSMGPVEAASIF